ncbi:hypothetical protein Taro_013489 [Colocasia esculenta]|uniref:Uncharacterized protein n=1 Tax=Colocasia esculenta TaxID=4460 RepID=A0A843UBR7_COLES|nr:hypothetical protein [Colocasia esculenta]
MSLKLAGVVWRNSWGLGSYGSTTGRTSSSPVRLLRPAQTVHLKPIKDADRARRVSKGSSLAPMTESHKYTVNHGTQTKDLRTRRLDRPRSQADRDKNSVTI